MIKQRRERIKKVKKCWALPLISIALGCAPSRAEINQRATDYRTQHCAETPDPAWIFEPGRVVVIAPLTSDVPRGKAGPASYYRGARLGVHPPAPIGAAALEEALRCHGVRQLLAGAATPDPFWLPDAWVTVSVQGSGEQLLVEVKSERIEDGARLLDRARAFAPEARGAGT